MNNAGITSSDAHSFVVVDKAMDNLESLGQVHSSERLLRGGRGSKHEETIDNDIADISTRAWEDEMEEALRNLENELEIVRQMRELEEENEDKEDELYAEEDPNKNHSFVDNQEVRFISIVCSLLLMNPEVQEILQHLKHYCFRF